MITIEIQKETIVQQLYDIFQLRPNIQNASLLSRHFYFLQTMGILAGNTCPCLLYLVAIFISLNQNKSKCHKVHFRYYAISLPLQIEIAIFPSRCASKNFAFNLCSFAIFLLLLCGYTEYLTSVCLHDINLIFRGPFKLKFNENTLFSDLSSHIFICST